MEPARDLLQWHALLLMVLNLQALQPAITLIGKMGLGKEIVRLGGR
jgi:hypothetical protein